MSASPKTRVFVIVFVTIVIFAIMVISTTPGSALSHLTSPLSGVLTPISRFFGGVGGWFSDRWESLTSGAELIAENDRLRAENAELRSRMARHAEAVQEYEAFKNALQIKEQFSDYEMMGTYVINRELSPWFDLIRIDRGTFDGLQVSAEQAYAVVDAGANLLGRVVSADISSAKVLPILHEAFSASVRIDRTDGAVCRARGDLLHKDQMLLVLDQIPQTAALTVGDRIVTSGQGGYYPAGLQLGTVREIFVSEGGSERWATLEPTADLSKLSLVFILKGKTAP